MERNMIVQVIGLGYIGLPTAAIVAGNGIYVNGTDVNPKIVDAIANGNIRTVEPGLLERVKASVDNGYLTASITPRAADVHLMVVPTPFKNNHEPDISFVEAGTKAIVPFLREYDTYIIESTCPIGTTEKMAELVFGIRPELKGKLYIAYCPERVMPGNVLHELIYNDRVIGGVDPESTEKATHFYQHFVQGALHKTNARTAEMCKLVENASRDVQIAFANELSIICDRASIDVWELIHLANKHPRVNILRPGPGVGGHCIAVDPYFIVNEYPLESRIIGMARGINNYKAFWCAERIGNAILEFKTKRGRAPCTALMGLAFKPNIDDLRESPALYIANRVIRNSHDDFLVVEPNIQIHSTFFLTDYVDAYERADVVAMLVAHKEFSALRYTTEKVILDFAGVFAQ